MEPIIMPYTKIMRTKKTSAEEKLQKKEVLMIVEARVNVILVHISWLGEA